MNRRAIVLLYHDVINGDDPDISGFGGKNAAEYKLSVKEFERHLLSIKEALKGSVITANEVSSPDFSSPPVLFSFDDGGLSSYTHIAPMLEHYGWHGCFFITTDYIDKPAFVSSEQIRELDQRGHTIGSHSCSHPRKISDCSREQLHKEWSNSLAVLADILGRPVRVASIPGGFYSRQIVEVAAECGVRQLFTSEPVQKITRVGDCDVIGRFSVKRGCDQAIPAEFVASNLVRRFRQYGYWNFKKSLKVVAGPVYARLRTYVLARR